ncbi:MAG: hypothetical protein HQ583_00390 [Candidatus Abyssubacteria bacterium]|nr:hypothetical protein [Candidatus Abyssubacteria bacterium]
MKKAILILAVLLILAASAGAGAFQIEKSALYVFLHEVKPIEEEAAKALKDEKYALALRKYREALRGYERIWKDYPDLASSRPYGIDQMVDESIEGCKKIIEKIKDRGEAQDAFYLKLSEAVRVDFSDRDIYSVAKALTFLTDVNIIVDKTVFTDSNEALSPRVTVRTDEPWPLRTIITRLCQQTGLAYSIEADHVFISTRVKLDEQK